MLSCIDIFTLKTIIRKKTQFKQMEEDLLVFVNFQGPAWDQVWSDSDGLLG